MRLRVQKLSVTDKNFELEHSEAVSGVGWLNAEDVLSIGDDHRFLQWNVSTGKAQILSISSSLNNTNFKNTFYPTVLHFAPKVDALPGSNSGGNRSRTSLNRANVSNNLLLIATTEGKIYLMNASGRVEKIIDAHKGAALAAKWSADGSGFITSGEDGAIKIWSKNGMLRSILMQSGRAIYAVDWNASATKVAFCIGEECYVKSLKAQNNPIKWKAHKGLILCMEWSTGTNLIATGGEDCRYRVWDDLGRPLYSSNEHNYPITAISWNPTGELLAIGSHNLLRLADKAGWSHSLNKPSSGSIYSISWSSDGTQFVAGCADGSMLHAHVVEKRSMWECLEAIQTEMKTIEMRDVTSDVAIEKLETRDRITKWELGFGYLVVATTKQFYIFSAKSWNTPTINELKSSDFGANVNLVQIYNYDGHMQSQIRLGFIGSGSIIGGGAGNSITQTDKLFNFLTIALSNDTLVVRDRFQNSIIRFFDVLNGNSIGNAKFVHSCEIVELAVNQCGGISDRCVAFVDANKDCFLVRINSYATQQNAEKIGTQVHNLTFNNSTNILAAFQNNELIICPFPSVVFIDKNLLPKTIVNIGSADNFGKSAFIDAFVRNTITVKKSDGCLVTFYVPPFISCLLRCVSSSNWDQAVRICRSAQENYLWAILAGLSAAQNNYNVAEICYGQLSEFKAEKSILTLPSPINDNTEKVLFLNEIRTETNVQLRNAMMALFNGNSREADFALVQNGQYFRAIMLNLALFNFERALDLALKSQTHIDTVLGYRQRYLEQTGRRETDPKFLKHLSQIEIDWAHICNKIAQDQARYK